MNQLTKGYAGLYHLLHLVFNIFITHLYYRKVFKLLLHLWFTRIATRLQEVAMASKTVVSPNCRC